MKVLERKNEKIYRHFGKNKKIVQLHKKDKNKRKCFGKNGKNKDRIVSPVFVNINVQDLH